jgi:hypothetical protein
MLKHNETSSNGTVCWSMARLPHGLQTTHGWRLQDGQQPGMLTILAGFVPKQRGDLALTQSEIRPAESSGLGVRRRTR